MRFSHKLRKIGDPRLLRSARRHLGRVALTRRFMFRLDPQEIVASIDPVQFQAIHDRYAVDDPGGSWRKYLDLDRWIRINLRRVEDLELDWGRCKSVLDIGSGTGYFLYISRWLGHRTLGLDIETVPMFGEMFRALGLERVISRVEAFQPLPAFDRKFDLITAFMICFNGHKSPKLWGPKEWAFFLDDAATRLNPGGCIRLGFNRERDDSFYTEELRRFFLDRGGTIDEHRIILRPDGRRR
jgi:SAM-dependent methyltransferase